MQKITVFLYVSCTDDKEMDFYINVILTFMLDFMLMLHF